MRNLILVDLLRITSLAILELAEGYAAREELINLLQRPSLKLWDKEEDQNNHDNVDGAIDEPNFPAQICILSVDEIR